MIKRIFMLFVYPLCICIPLLASLQHLPQDVYLQLLNTMNPRDTLIALNSLTRTSKFLRTLLFTKKFVQLAEKKLKERKKDFAFFKDCIEDNKDYARFLLDMFYHPLRKPVDIKPHQNLKIRGLYSIISIHESTKMLSMCIKYGLDLFEWEVLSECVGYRQMFDFVFHLKVDLRAFDSAVRFSDTGNLYYMEQLLKAGANPNQRLIHKYGYDFPLIHCARNENYYACKLLLKYGANVDIQNSFGDYPLHIALNKHIIKLLIKYKANPFLKHRSKETNSFEEAELFKDWDKLDILEDAYNYN